MFSLISVLVKIFVHQFYERNAGFFFFVFFLMFGMVESSQVVSYHQAMMTGILTSSIFLLCVCAVWFIYLLKCMSFLQGALRQPENSFVFQLSQRKRSTQFLCVLLILALLYMPVLIYAILTVGLGLSKGLIVPSLEIIGFQSFVLTSAAGWFVIVFNTSHRVFWRIALPTLRWPWPKPFPFFYLNLLLSHLPTAFFVTKLFSIFSIYGFFQITLDHYENRVALMGCLAGLTAHAVIVFEFRKFEEKNLSFLRNLPLSLSNRFVQLGFVYGLLLLPETIMLIANHVMLQDVFGIYCLGVGILLFSHCRLYLELNNDRHTQWTLGIFLISFMLVLFKLYWVELAAVWVLAYVTFKNNFYRFEST